MRATVSIAFWASAVVLSGPAYSQTSGDEGVGQFPRQWTSESGTVILHAPEIEAWPDFETVEARAAVEVTLAENGGSSIGSVRFTASTETNLDLRLVAIDDIEVTAVNFSVMVTEEHAERFESVIRENLPTNPQEIPVEVVLSYISPDAALPTPEGMRVEAPPIFYSTTPAVLLQTDGEPLLAPIPDTRLQFVINTNWDLFKYRDRDWYLLNGSAWLKSRELTGPWEYTRSLPRDFRDLPADENWRAAHAAMPAERAEGDPPAVLVSDRPAELILLDGEANLESIGGSGLQYVTNTGNDLFVYDDNYYFLVSGRWFRAERLRGPWTHMTALPEPFADIPTDHAKAHVRAAIPNTAEARLAALEALIPRRATISRDAGNNVSVAYQGEPQYETIAGTDVSRVTNSPNDVLLADGKFYLCLNAVWYVSNESDGPWEVADSIPASIYNIPASSPAYHVTHVNVYESDDDTVSSGYTSGYLGVYVSYGVAMYGTGWYYPPYYYYDPFYGYPIYYPYPYSYGSAAYYNPNTGMYGRANTVYGPYGGYGRTAAYNPETGTYARGQAVWDSNEIAGSGVAYNPRTGTGVATNRYAYEDGGWGETLITRDDRWVYSESEWTENTRRTEFETSGGASGTVNRGQQGEVVTRETDIARGDQSLSTRSARAEQGGISNIQTGGGESLTLARGADGGDLYAGSDGNVYRRSEDGWSQHDGTGWQPVEVPEAQAQRIEQGRGQAQDRLDGAGSSLSAQQRSAASDRLSSRQVDQGRSGSFSDAFNSNQRRQLDRSYGARSGGYSRFNSRQGSRGRLRR